MFDLISTQEKSSLNLYEKDTNFTQKQDKVNSENKNMGENKK